MIEKIVTPRMGEGVTQVNVIRWLKQPGDEIHEYEPLVEVETDKVATEIPSPVNGRLSGILIPAGEVAQVGDILAEIETERTDETEQPNPTNVTPQAHTVAAISETTKLPDAEEKIHDRTWISPIVAKIAKENQVDLNKVRGTGLASRITKQDILTYLEQKPAVVTLITSAGSDQLLPITSIRRQIAEHLQHSIQSAPHVLTVMEADLSLVLKDHNNQKEEFKTRGVKLTLTAYFIRAIAAALRSNPLVNASWTDNGILLHPNVHIGMAVSLGADGLIVPVIRDADALNLFGIARAIQDLSDRARNKKLLADEVKGATFTLTNHGIGGSLFATPIINQPQTGILGTGQVQKRVVVITDSYGHDSIAIRPMVYLSFVFDHRLLDGSTADQFLRQVKQHLEAESLP